MEVSRVIELELVGVRVELPHNQPIVLLKERAGERFLPIWIGAVEATSIAFAMQGVVTQRPMTHDLMRDLLSGLRVRVDRIVVTALREGTFYAEIQMTNDGESVVVSSRPSDAIALAVRATVPIFADEQVLAEAGIEIEDDDEAQVEQFKAFIDSVSPEDFR
jgi:bifunctional DNase/RNase